MIESIKAQEALFHELLNHSPSASTGSTNTNSSSTSGNIQNSVLAQIIRSSKFWNSIKLLENLVEPFLAIIHAMNQSITNSSNNNGNGNAIDTTNNNNSNNSSHINIAEIASYWIYLRNHLSNLLPKMTDDFAHFIIKLFNYKYASNHFHADLYKVALFLHPRYKASFENMGTPAAPPSPVNATSSTAGNVSGGNSAAGTATAAAAGASGSGTGNDSNFKQILRFSCTFIQHFGYDENEIRHLIYQLVLYRDSQIISTLASNTNLSQYWNNLDVNALSSTGNSNGDDNNGNSTSSDAANVGTSSGNVNTAAASAAGTTSSASSSVVPKSDILKRFASQLFDIVPLIQTNMKTGIIGMNGLLNGFGKIESPDSNRFITTGFVADIWHKNKFEKRSNNYISMMNAIQIHQSFSRNRASGAEKSVVASFGSGGTVNYEDFINNAAASAMESVTNNHHLNQQHQQQQQQQQPVSEISSFRDALIDRNELIGYLEVMYRRDLSLLYSATNTANSAAAGGANSLADILNSANYLLKIDGVNYHHPIFQADSQDYKQARSKLAAFGLVMHHAQLHHQQQGGGAGGVASLLGAMGGQQQQQPASDVMYMYANNSANAHFNAGYAATNAGQQQSLGTDLANSSNVQIYHQLQQQQQQQMHNMQQQQYGGSQAVSMQQQSQYQQQQQQTAAHQPQSHQHQQQNQQQQQHQHQLAAQNQNYDIDALIEMTL